MALIEGSSLIISLAVGIIVTVVIMVSLRDNILIEIRSFMTQEMCVWSIASSLMMTCGWDVERLNDT